MLGSKSTAVALLNLFLLFASPAAAAPATFPKRWEQSAYLRLARDGDNLSQSTTVQVTNILQTSVGPMIQTCTITLDPITGDNGEPLVRETKSCTLAVAGDNASGTDGSSSLSSASGSSSTDSSSASATSTATGSSSASSSDSSSSSSAVSASASTTATDSSAAGTASATASSAAATATGSSGGAAISVDGTSMVAGTALSSGSTDTAAATGTASSAAAATTGGSSSIAESSVATGSTGSAAADSTGTATTAASALGDASTAATSAADSASSSPAAKFQLPGTQLLVLPIGLGVFAGISVIALIVVGLVTYERTKYRKAFRQRKLAESGATMGYGGMAQAA
ncbi:hypothetical protein LXA43DRAFT_1011990 [Ganoderma leucocontextum]|nr:hypothetical protein LXA43DRAFT_1011990 [Ganoderma leucocontextum]